MTAPDDFEAWFRLLETPGLGRAGARRLLAACGSPEGVFGTAAAALRQIVGPEAAAALARQPPLFDDRLDAAKRWLAGARAAVRRVLTLDLPAYPRQLLETADPPLLLYVEGEAACLGEPSIAIVGSRHATAQGLDNARAFAAELSRQGLVVVSGLALGIDAAAHEGALEGRAGTVAVLGTGLDPVYPARHQALARRIAGHGALVSEFAPGTPPLREHFPLRNRIIAGLARGTLVVEAAPQSGSLITARQAAEAGREVFAIPGSIHSPQSRGCHALIKQGAKLVESAADILDELPGPARPRSRTPAAATPTPPEQSDPLLAALGHDPTTLDALQARTGWSTAELGARLLELELEGRVARLPGGLYQRRGTA
ncbi:MAG TPA: DNA-processing protein DprA [Rubrivivax sp.]|nr:DNA-processing protein DprA [Rubrivivax sp.]